MLVLALALADSLVLAEVDVLAEVLVLVDSVEKPEEIDIVRAQREIDEAKEILLQKRSRQEYQIAQATMARALNRLRVKNMGIGR